MPKPDVVITSFEALVSDAAALKALSWDFVVVDERTRMQSALTRAYQAVYGIHCRARAIVAHSSLLKTVSMLTIQTESFGAHQAYAVKMLLLLWHISKYLWMRAQSLLA